MTVRILEIAGKNAADAGTSTWTLVKIQFPRESTNAPKSGQFVVRTCEVTAIPGLPSAVRASFPKMTVRILGMAERNAEDTGTSIQTQSKSQFPRESMIANSW